MTTARSFWSARGKRYPARRRFEAGLKKAVPRYACHRTPKKGTRPFPYRVPESIKIMIMITIKKYGPVSYSVLNLARNRDLNRC